MRAFASRSLSDERSTTRHLATTLLSWHAARRRVPRAGFGSMPSLKALGYQSPNEKLNIAGIGAGGRADDVLGGCDSENIVALADVDWARGARRVQALPEGDALQGLPQDARQGRQEHRRRDHRDSRSHARDRRARRDAARQARLRREAAHAHAVGSAPAHRRRGEVQSRDADGQPGLLARSDARRRRDHLVRRDRRRHRSPRVRGRAGWPQGMQTLPRAEKVPDTLDWDLWLGTAAWREYTSGDDAWRKRTTSSSTASTCRSTGAGSTTSARA